MSFNALYAYYYPHKSRNVPPGEPGTEPGPAQFRAQIETRQSRRAMRLLLARGKQENSAAPLVENPTRKFSR
jgi:hypothetical protein